jgi:hypothetical protein
MTAAQIELVDERLPAYLVHAAMAGAYIVLAIVLVFAFGTALLGTVFEPLSGMVMAATFGLARTAGRVCRGRTSSAPRYLKTIVQQIRIYYTEYNLIHGISHNKSNAHLLSHPISGVCKRLCLYTRVNRYCRMRNSESIEVNGPKVGRVRIHVEGVDE